MWKGCARDESQMYLKFNRFAETGELDLCCMGSSRNSQEQLSWWELQFRTVQGQAYRFLHVAQWYWDEINPQQEFWNVPGGPWWTCILQVSQISRVFILERKLSTAACREQCNCLWLILKLPSAQRNQGAKAVAISQESNNPKLHLWRRFLGLGLRNVYNLQNWVCGCHWPSPTAM